MLAGIGIFHGVQDRQLFFLCLAGQTLDRQSNMPDIARLGVLAAYTLCTAAFIIIRICTAEHKITGVFHNLTVIRLVAKVIHSQQAGYICIVHQHILTVAVYFVCINLTIVIVIYDRHAFDGIVDLFFQGSRFCCQSLIL